MKRLISACLAFVLILGTLSGLVPAAGVHTIDNPSISTTQAAVILNPTGNTPAVPAKYTTEDVQKILQETALAYYYHNPYVQYDGLGVTYNKSLERHRDSGAPEDAAVDSQVYSVCSNYCWKVYENAFGHNLFRMTNARTRTWADFDPAVTPELVYQYSGPSAVNSKGETNLTKAVKESRALLQPGDIIVYADTASGHAMLFVGDCLGDGKEYVLHCWGDSYTASTGYDYPEPGGSIKLQNVDTCVYSNTDSPNCYLGRANRTTVGFAILRPTLDPKFPTKPTATGIARLQYPGLNVWRELDRLKFESALPGEEIPVYLTIANKGRTTLDEVPVVEYIPAGTTLVEGSLTQGAKVEGNTIKWAVKLPAKTEITLTYKVKLNAKVGDTVEFKGGLVGGIASRSTALVVGGRDLSTVDYNTIFTYGTNLAKQGLSGSYQDLDFFNLFYKNALGIDLKLPATTQQFLNKIATATSTDITRKTSVAAADVPLSRMILPLHFTGQRVLHKSNWDRVRNYNEAFYKPGDLFVCLDGNNLTGVKSTTDLDLYVYLGNGKVLQYTTAGLSVVNFATSIGYALRYNVLVALRPSLVDGLVPADSIKVAGYTPANGTEIVYAAERRVMTDDPDNRVYSTVEGAFAAAVQEWSKTYAGTINLYTDVTITSATLYDNEANTGIFYVPNGNLIDLTLNLNGNTIDSHEGMKENTTGPFMISVANTTAGDQKVTINGGKDAEGNNGKIIWNSYRAIFYDTNRTAGDTHTTVTFNNVDVDKHNCGTTINGNVLAPNSPGFVVNVIGGTWNLTGDNGAGKFFRSGCTTATAYFTGGAEINADVSGIFYGSGTTRIIRVYADDATFNVVGVTQTAPYGLLGTPYKANSAVAWRNVKGTVTATAIFAENRIVVIPDEPETYAVEIADAENGTVTADVTEAKEGETVTVTATAAEGYELDTITAEGATLTGGENGVYTFVMPAGEVTVTVTFKATYVEDPITFASTGFGANVSLENEIFMNVYLTLTGFGDVDPATLTDRIGVLFWDEANKPASAEEAVYGTQTSHSLEVTYTGNGRYDTTAAGIPAKKMGDSMAIRAYYINANGEYVYSKYVADYSVKKYCDNKIKGTDEGLKAVCIALLNYGAAAQNMLKYKTDALMNAHLSAELQTLNWTDDMVRTKEEWTVPAAKQAGLERDTAYFTSVGANLTLDGAIDYTYYFKASGTVADAKILVWTEAEYEAAEVLSAENATVLTIEYSTANSRYEYTYAGLPAKKMFSPIYACAMFTDAEGNVHYSGVNAYCPERYGTLNYQKAEPTQNMAKSMVIYGLAAKAYFG